MRVRLQGLPLFRHIFQADRKRTAPEGVRSNNRSMSKANTARSDAGQWLNWKGGNLLFGQGVEPIH